VESRRTIIVKLHHNPSSFQLPDFDVEKDTWTGRLIEVLGLELFRIHAWLGWVAKRDLRSVEKGGRF
jgi:hypothetical protein